LLHATARYHAQRNFLHSQGQQTWINCFNYAVTAQQDQLVSANYMHWLVRDNSPTSWPVANFSTFTAALKRYWES
jgi:hypothetical protein